MFERRFDGIFRKTRTLHRAEGVERLFAPGMLEAEIAAHNQEHVIPLNEDTVRGLIGAANQFDVDHG